MECSRFHRNCWGRDEALPRRQALGPRQSRRPRRLDVDLAPYLDGVGPDSDPPGHNRVSLTTDLVTGTHTDVRTVSLVIYRLRSGQGNFRSRVGQR